MRENKTTAKEVSDKQKPNLFSIYIGCTKRIPRCILALVNSCGGFTDVPQSGRPHLQLQFWALCEMLTPWSMFTAWQALFAEGPVNSRIETLCLRKQHDKSWTGPYVCCCHTDDEMGFLGYVLTIGLTAAQLVETVCLVCQCVYFALVLFPFPRGYRDCELHSWPILASCNNKLYVIYMFLSAMHSWNVYEVFCTLCMWHENRRGCWCRCGTRVQLYRPWPIQVGKNIIAVINKWLSSASLLVFP